ncbi:hypothetical protein HPP92_013951 [Vanilla planifolia]|uniref:RING-type domain-containing protein n=1 Tax=Vanilla planifolia TaxID=51239 RepID=A0A835UVR6_VANPL|nr:hypothetical protein HPP92_014395 [Vanilla planifolia]KAG0474265.1 hypothetical protein HPP92_013951 [Vanilla planifolia]
MDFLGAPSPSRINLTGNERQTSPIAEKIGRFTRVTICAIFVLVGSLVGAITGGVIGLSNENGLLRGSGIGSISGAVFSIEAVESVVALWGSNDSVVWMILYVMDILCSLLSGRLVREKVRPAVRSAVYRQITAYMGFWNEEYDIFESCGWRGRGLSWDFLNKLPKTAITERNEFDFRRVICVVCLQDLVVGDMARILPCCHHKFHLNCIDDWLVEQGNCPLCRLDLLNSSSL